MYIIFLVKEILQMHIDDALDWVDQFELVIIIINCLQPCLGVTVFRDTPNALMNSWHL